jgi:hypothetical protein
MMTMGAMRTGKMATVATVMAVVAIKAMTVTPVVEHKEE